jgi:hypothetical protein
MTNYRSGWRVALASAVMAGLLLSCSSDDSDDQTPSLSPDPEDVGMPADAEPVTTPEGDRVYVSESAATVYGPCDIIEPHEDDIAAWLELDPPRGFSDFGVVCT